METSIISLRNPEGSVEEMRRSVTGNRLFDEGFEAGYRNRIAARVERFLGRAGTAGRD